MIAIVGSVGCGKSSFLSSLLGEMNKLSGRLNVNGRLSFIPQQAWIQNATVKNNILFGKAYSQEFYNQVVSVCALTTDFNILPAGDQTEIGEKGINLSGGQKQRISLSRAVYSESDIYLLDDPLSAVDAHVGKQIFDSVIGPNGILKAQTRLFVTNSLSFLPQVDEIILLENGSIKAYGNYKTLTQSNDVFNKFISNYFKNNETNVEEADPLRDKKRSGTVKQDKLIENDNEFKIIETEKIEKGNVKFFNVKEFFKASGYGFILVNFLLYLAYHVTTSLGNFWLSDWSNKSKEEFGDLGKKQERILVFFGIGFVASKFEFSFGLIQSMEPENQKF